MNCIYRTISNKSTGLFKLLLLGLLPLILSSCSEEVITIDLKDAEPKIVIEGTLSDQGEPCTVKISKSGDFYKPGIYPPVTSATVILSDSEGNTELLAESEPGLYHGNSLFGVEGWSYTLKVEAEGKTYEAVSTLMQAVEIDSLTYYFEDDPNVHRDEYEDIEEGYVFSCNFTYPETEGRHFRIRLALNGESLQDIFLVDDWYDSGDDVDYDFSNIHLFEKYDTMKVELLSIDKSVYDYFSTLADALLSTDTGPVFSSIPDNPLSNFTNGALGYFAAYSVRSKTVVFE